MDSRFGTAANRVTQFIGGGVPVLDKSRAVSSATLKVIGKFDQGEGGLAAPQRFEIGSYAKLSY